jgi:hypothetical protein
MTFDQMVFDLIPVLSAILEELTPEQARRVAAKLRTIDTDGSRQAKLYAELATNLEDAAVAMEA